MYCFYCLNIASKWICCIYFFIEIDKSDNSQWFKVHLDIEINDCFLHEIHEREKIRKSISKYGNIFEYLVIN